MHIKNDPTHPKNKSKRQMDVEPKTTEDRQEKR